MKNIQISKDLFIKLIKYHHFDMYEFEDEIKSELEKKLNLAAMREYYTAYKTAPQSRSVRKHAKNISMKEVCRIALGGKSSLRDITEMWYISVEVMRATNYRQSDEYIARALC